MQIYNYSKATGEFVGVSTARLDPIDSNPLIPAFATATAPPATGQYQVAVFQDDAWSVEEDHRDREAWSTVDASRVAIDFIGPQPENVTFIDPSLVKHPVWDGSQWATDRDSLLFEILGEIDQKTNGLIEKGWVCEGQQVRLNRGDQLNYEGEKNLYAELDYDGVDVSGYFPLNVKVWTDGNGAPVMLPMNSLADYKTFIRAGKAFIRGKLEEGWTLKTQLTAMTLEDLLNWNDPRS